MGFVHYKLLDKKTDKNSFFLDANGAEDHTRKLDFNNSYGILNPYFVINEKGVREYRRYIIGCPIYDPAEQDKQKIVANKQTTLVQFTRGADIDLDEVKGKVLIDWLDGHPWNTSGKNHDPETHDAVFFKWDPKEDVEKDYDIAKAEDEAMIILGLLQKNEERMRAVALVFEETKGLADDKEIYLGLRKVARERPIQFKNSIANRENEVLTDVLKALKYQIIGRDAKAFFYEEDKSVIFATTTKAAKDANSELVTFLMDRKGDIQYRQLLIKIQQKEIELSAPVGLMPPPKAEE